jgi:hypothetical protein
MIAEPAHQYIPNRHIPAKMLERRKPLTRKDRTIAAYEVYTIPGAIERIDGIFEPFLEVLVVFVVRLGRDVD